MLPLSADDPRVIGEFRLHARLGAGGMGRVYLASSPGGRAVAVKVVHAHLARDASFLGRFRREVATAQAVNGAYTAPVVAAGPDDDPPWLATAYVAGPSLQEAVAETGPLPEDAVLKLAAGLAEALQVIHNSGLVHRDLKPANVLLADDGPRVIDFGIARALDSTEVTLAGSVLGTPSFMSPEQAQGKPTGPASDLFSLGSVVYFAAMGAGPFGSGSHAVLLYRIVHTEPDLDRLPPEVRDLVAACLARDPAKRPDPARVAASLMGALPPGDSPPMFWPAPVALLIADHQARFTARLMAAEPSSPQALTVAVAPAIPSPPVALATPPPPAAPVTSPPLVPLVAPATPPLTATEAGPTDAPLARTGQTEPVPGMGRRRALAALAGAATAGLVVGGWELTRPGPPRPKTSAADLAAQSRARSSPPGTKLWSFEANGTVASIAVAGGVAYVGTVQRALYALDALTGRLLWRHLMASGKTTSLVVASGAVIAANGYNGVQPAGYIGGVYGLDPGTGKLLWNIDAAGVTSLATAGDVVYAGTAVKTNLTGGITALSIGSGELLWTFDFPTQEDVQTGVAVASDVVYTTTFRGEIWALKGTTGDVLWRFAEPNTRFPTGLGVKDGVVYASSGQNTDNSNPVLYALKASTGRVLWQHPLAASPYGATFDAGGGLIFPGIVRVPNSLRADAGELSALNIATGQLLWQTPVAGGMEAVAAGPGNVVYSTNSYDVLDAWQANTGNHLWSYRGAGTSGTLIKMGDGIAYFGGGGRVYAVVARP